jgi:pimeloyl-ACP methyl ester carboxylesterase
MATFVLVPGAWLGAWAWDAVTGRLRAAGHEVHPVTLTGVAERAAEAGPQVDLDTHTEDLIRQITEPDLRDVVLVAHSYGGFPATAAAQRLPERIAQVIYVDSGPIPDGTSQQSMVEPDEQASPDADLVPPPAWDPATEPNLDGLDDAALALLRKRSTPQPAGTVRQPIHRTGRLSMPLALVSCIFPLAQVRQMIDAGHPFFAELAGARLRELPTSHWPMFSEPDRLAALLAELAGTTA